MFLRITAFFLAVMSCVAFAQDQTPDSHELTPEQLEYQAWAMGILDELNPQTGAINLDAASVTLNVPEAFYFLDAKDAETVLVDVWGNMPGQNVLGMLMPTGKTAFDATSWGVTIEYVEDGFVSDEDAGDIDYDELLQQMQKDTLESSDVRVEQGYEPIALVGWASPPYYDSDAKKLHWAKELAIGDNPQNTLNYNIRILGRKGFLLMNFIAGMEQKPEIDQNLDQVLAIADFDQGASYADFDPEIDKVAAYGIGALVAGKVLAKTGLIAVLIALFKKFGIFIVVGIGAYLKSFFGRKKASSD